MKALIPTSAYRKDVSAPQSAAMISPSSLPCSNCCRREKLCARPLKGDWKGYWECHLQADWLLIYKATADEVRLARTGTHADLFGK
jgi:addiction module RelE/StbE family toxin